MKLYELLENVEIQGETKIVYYDDEKNERIELTKKEASYKEILYIYPEKDIIYIEVEKQDG